MAEVVDVVSGMRHGGGLLLVYRLGWLLHGNHGECFFKLCLHLCYALLCLYRSICMFCD